MSRSESREHRLIKNLIDSKLREWLGVSVTEYSSVGHELDAFGATIEGIGLYIEIIWSSQKMHFLHDMNLLQQSDADIKIVIGSRTVIANEEFGREFSKIVVSQRRKGYLVHGKMLEGEKILDDKEFLDKEVKSLVLKLIGKFKTLHHTGAGGDIWYRASGVIDLSTRKKRTLNKSLREYCFRIVDDYDNFSAFRRKNIRPIIDQLSKFDLKRYFVPLDVRDLIHYYTKDAESFINQWIEKDDRKGLLILGDFGTGKSTLVAHVSVKLARRFLRMPESRIPIFVPLRDVEMISKESILNVVRRVINTDWETISWLAESGRLVFILDGFDEIMKRTDWRKTLADFQAVVDLFCNRNSKVIVTCRTHYFLKDSYIWGEETSLMERLRATKHFRIISIEPFEEDRILDFLQRRMTNPNEIWEQINKTYNLRDLCSRPLLIDMIVSSLPELVSSGMRIDPASLYDTYTGIWIKQEDWRSQLGPIQKAELMEEIALDMFLRDKLEMSSNSIREIIEVKLKTKAGSEVADYFDYDIRTCSFFNRDSAGNYGFMHKSFLEFFIAKRLAKEINNGSFLHLGAKPLTLEITHFTALMIKSKEILWNALYQTREKSLDEAGFLGGNALGTLMMLGEDLQGKDFSSCAIANVDLNFTKVKGCRFAHAKLRDVSFESTSISDSTFTEGYLDSCIFKGAKLANVNLSRASIRGTSFENAEFKACSMRRARLHLCSFAKAKLIGVDMMKASCDQVSTSVWPLDNEAVASIVESDLQSVEFKNSTLMHSIIHKSILRGSRFNQCNLRGTCISLCDSKSVSIKGGSASFASIINSKCRNLSFEGTRLFQTSIADEKLEGIKLRQTFVRKDERKLHKLSKSEDEVTVKLDPNLPALCALDVVVDKLHLSTSLERKALRMFSVTKNFAMLSSSHEKIGAIAACLYAIMRNSGNPVNLKGMAKFFGVSIRAVARRYRALVTRGQVKWISIDPQYCVQVLSKKLRVKKKSLALAKRIIAFAGKDTTGRSPYTVAAGALYLACKMNYEGLTQCSIARAAAITRPSIYNVCSRLLSNYQIKDLMHSAN